MEAGWCREQQQDYENLGKVIRYAAEGIESLEIRERLRGFQVPVVAVVCDSEM